MASGYVYSLQNCIFKKMFLKVTYDNIKSHKKTGLHPFCEKQIFGKATASCAQKMTFFCEKLDWQSPRKVLIKRCSEMFSKNNRKKPVPQCHFFLFLIKLQAYVQIISWKRNPRCSCFLMNFQNFTSKLLYVRRCIQNFCKIKKMKDFAKILNGF